MGMFTKSWTEEYEPDEDIDQDQLCYDYSEKVWKDSKGRHCNQFGKVIYDPNE